MSEAGVLPALRPELRILSGPLGRDGAPTWTLHDPVRNRFFRLGWREYELLSRWGEGSAERLAARAETETMLRIEPEAVAELAAFLGKNGLLRADDPGGPERLAALTGKRHGMHRLLGSYLFFRVPLFRPDRWLLRTLPLAQPFFSRLFWVAVAVAGGAGLLLALRQWDRFLATFVDFLTPAGLIGFGLALVAAKVAHELAHAFTAKRAGCRVPRIGVGFILLWPVLYTDVSDAWRLTDRWQRLRIGAAGVAVEIAIGAFALLAWSLLPDGHLRGVAFLLATTTLAITLLVNLNPLMRFDGYYLLSDWVDEANLQPRAFTLGRWQLREWLFGFGDPPPESLPRRRQSAFILYGYACWIYRLLLILGLALLAYTLVFKLLGVLILLVEVGWLIGGPVLREVQVWWGRRSSVRWNRRSIGAMTLFGLFLALLVVPWHGEITSPAVASGTAVALYAPAPARIDRVLVEEGQAVGRGERLVELSAPDFDHQLEVLGARIEALEWRMDHEPPSPVLMEELGAALAEQRGLLEQKAKLSLVAPAAGVIADLAPGLSPGRWVGRDLALALVLDSDRVFVEAWIPEAEVGRIQPGAAARFVSEGLELPLRVSRIDSAATESLRRPYVAAVYGGTLPVRQDSSGGLVPVKNVYRVRLDPAEPKALAQVRTGMASIETERISPLGWLWRGVAEVIIRESGF